MNEETSLFAQVNSLTIDSKKQIMRTKRHVRRGPCGL